MKPKIIIASFFIWAAVSCANENTPDNSELTTVDTIKSMEIENDSVEAEPKPNQRFGKSEITNPVFDTTLLFGVWTQSHNDPACYFRLDKDFYTICDYDGNGERLYKINEDSIFLDNPYLIFKGRIIRVTKDTLEIHWQENDNAEILLRWKD